MMKTFVLRVLVAGCIGLAAPALVLIAAPGLAQASEAKGRVASFSFSGEDDHSVFFFRLSSQVLHGPTCNTSYSYAIHLNVRGAVFAASLISNSQNKSLWKEPLSIVVTGTGTCTNGANAEDAHLITINDGDKQVATYDVEPTKVNEVPVDTNYPLPPVVRNVKWPAVSPLLRSELNQFWHDYCYSAADMPNKWWTHRSQQVFSAKLLSMKIPFVSYVANGSMGSVCFVGSLFGRGFFDEQGWRTYTEHIVGHTATMLWRNNNIDGVGGAVFYYEDGHWKIDFVYNFSLPGGMPGYIK